MYDLIIIGSGPAGLSAAVYGKRAGLKTVVLEKAPMSGGQILNTMEVDNYLGLPGINGFDMGMQFRAHADRLGVEFQETEVTALCPREGSWLIRTENGELAARAVILATGAVHAHLNVPGEETLSGMGVSYCATCDGAFFKGRTVAVVGGGDVALEDAIYLAGICEKVLLIHRREELRGAMILQSRLKELKNVEILYHSTVEEICGEDAVESLRVRNGRTGEISSLTVQGIFIAVGIHPNTELVKELLPLAEGGYIPAGEDCATALPGLYAAGDVRKKPLRQIITAVADGANAAVAAGIYCRE